jgi:phosphatidylinositol glycan class V
MKSFAFFSRIFTLLIGYLSSKIIYDYDTSATDYKLKAFVRWDAVYFLEIAKNGYSFEQQHAFLPGLPIMIRIIGEFLNFFIKDIDSSYVLAGLCISNISFILAAQALFDLSIALSFRPVTAKIAAIIFCISPASVFLSSIYTESIFALFTFKGMLMMAKRKHFSAAFFWALASSCRSNGIVFVGFFIWEIIYSFKKINIPVKVN